MRPALLDRLMEFLQESYADQPISAAFGDRELIARRWRWLNEEYPAPDHGAVPSWICLLEGQIVGHVGALPVIAAVRGAPIQLWWARDLIVSRRARGRGVGSRLISTVVQHGKLVFLAGMNPGVRSMYRRLGYRDLGSFPVHVRVHDAARFVASLRWPRLMQAFLRMGLVLRAKRVLRPRLSSCLRVEPFEGFDDSFEQWWSEVEHTREAVVRRTSATMNWRYRRHPTHRYTALVARAGSAVRGFAVVRHGRSRRLPTGFLVEVLAAPGDDEALDALVWHAQDILSGSAEEPSVFTRCTVLDRATAASLRRAGFLRVPSPIGWMAAGAGDGRSASNLLDRRLWFLNGGDSDLDAL